MKTHRIVLHSLAALGAYTITGGVFAAAPAAPAPAPAAPPAAQQALKLEDLPSAVRETIAASAHGEAIESIARRSKDGATSYVVRFAGANGQKGRRIEVTALGALVPPKAPEKAPDHAPKKN